MTILFYTVVALVGFVALSVSILGTIRSHIGAYWLLIAFYGLLTGRIAFVAVDQYLSVNVVTVSARTYLATNVAGTALDTAFMCVVTLYVHRLFVEKGRRVRDGIVIGAYAANLVLTLLPAARIVDLSRAVMRYSALGSTAYIMHMALFAYLLAVGIAGQKRDRPVRELVLIWSLIIFGLVVFLTDLWGLVRYLSGARDLPFTPAGNAFMGASIPHLLFGGILMYYFGAYILTDLKAPPAVSRTVVEEYRISTRERELIPYLNQGLSNREIAEKLFVSLATVKTHLHNIYEKTGTKSRYELFNLTRHEATPPD